MAKGPKYEFKIPQPSGLNAKVYTGKLKERPLYSQRPTDENQCAPTADSPVRNRVKMGGGY